MMQLKLYTHFLASTDFPDVMFPLPLLLGILRLVVSCWWGWWVMSTWSPTPGAKWCLCWWLLWPHSRNHAGSFLCLQAHFCTLFFLHCSAASCWIWICYAWCVQSVLLPVIMPVRPDFSAFFPSPEAPSAQLQAACPHLPLHELMTTGGALCRKLWLYNMKIKDK